MLYSSCLQYDEHLFAVQSAHHTDEKQKMYSIVNH
jgi:hypothetical protein